MSPNKSRAPKAGWRKRLDTAGDVAFNLIEGTILIGSIVLGAVIIALVVGAIAGLLAHSFHTAKVVAVMALIASLAFGVYSTLFKR